MKDGPVLLVDDDQGFCAALGAALRRRGKTVLLAHDAASALLEAKAFSPSGAVVDLRLPGVDGITLVASLRRALPDLVVVMLTGHGTIPSAVSAVKAGAAHYLTKPATAEEVLAALDGGKEALLAPPEAAPSQEVRSLPEVEWEHLSRVLAECDGNVSEAARRLSLHRRTLQRKLARRRG